MHQKHSKLNRKLRHVFPVVFYGLLIIFLVIYLLNLDIETLRTIEIHWLYLVLATFLGLGFRFWGVFIWISILRSLGAKNLTNKAELTFVYAKSWLGRYIPTPAAWMMGKVYFASKHGISKNKLAVSSLLEASLQIVVVMIVALLMLVFDRRLDVVEPKFKLLLFGIACTGIVLLSPKIFNYIIKTTYRLVKKKTLDIEHQVDRRTITKGALLYTLGAFISGASLFFIAKAVYPELTYSNVFFVMGVGNLAAAASMLAIFAPSGIGVREGIQLVLLSLIMPREFALVITIITRLWGIAIDFLFYGIAKFLAKR
jgi:uncharacterized membrane protein YbhN (UPF0104 family)